MSIPAAVSQPTSSLVTSGGPTLLRAVPAAPRSRETPRNAGETRRDARARIAQLAESFATSSIAEDAYTALWRGIGIAQDAKVEVPCLGPGGAAWVSEDLDDQELAAERCWDCPALTLCKRYADLAGEKGGTWGAVTRDPARVPGQSADAVRVRRRKAQNEGSGPECACGCEVRTKGGRYLPGHDAARVGQLVRYVRDRAISREHALRALADSPSLQAKLARHLDG